MSTVDYVPIANTADADVETQSQYLIDLAPGGSLDTGFRTGVAQSAQFNKVVRQSSVMSASLANFISEELASDVLDDGDVPALVLKIRAAIIAAVGNPFSTGDMKLTLKNVADSGWVLCNDGTIGSATSGATTRANADCQALFLLLWTNVSNTYAPVLPAGRGASAAADWAANKTLGLTKMMGRALAVYGAGSGLTARALGENTGAETVALTSNQLASHTHSLTDPGHVHVVTDPGHNHSYLVFTGGGPVGLIAEGSNQVEPSTTGTSVTGVTIASATTGITIGATGAGQGHPNMQPTSFINAMIKL